MSLDKILDIPQDFFGAIAAATSSNQINWGIIVQTILAGAVSYLAVQVIEQGRQAAVLAARYEALEHRHDAIERGNHIATNDRYRAGDAARDQAALKEMIQELRAEHYRSAVDIEGRMRAVEKEIRATRR